MKFKRLLSLLITSTLFFTGLYAQTTVLTLTSSGTNASAQTWTNIYCQPVTVRITVKGGGGGGGSDLYAYSNPPFLNIEKGSTGATMIGEFTVPPGHVLRAVAGGAGETGSVPNFPYNVRAGGGGGAGSGVVNATTSTLLILAAGGTGAHSYQPGIGASAATDGNGGGGSAGTWSTGGGGLNGPGASDGNNGCPTPGGGQVSLSGISQGADYCNYYYYAGDGGDGMGGGGSASNLGGGGGGHTGGGGGNDRSAAKSYNTGANQVNTNGSSDADPNPGTVLIELLTDVSNVPPDVTPPAVTCKSHTVSLSATGRVGIVPADVHQSSSDACGPVTLVSASPNLFNCTHIGPNTVTLTVRDASGNTATCTATVTVQDNIQPQVVCKGIVVTLGSNNSASIAPVDAFQSGSDNCGTVIPTSVSPNSFDCSDVGPNTIFLTASDGNGNTSACSSTVTVRDGTPPTVTCKNHAVSLSAAGTASVAPADVFQSGSDNCGTANPASVAPNSLTCANIGPNTVTLTVNDGNGNTATCNATVTVSDNTPPQVVCKNHIVALNSGGSASVAPSDVIQSGSDNCSTSNPTSVLPNSFTCAHIGPNTVTLTVNDGNGNTATCNATVTVSDNTPPQVVCKNHAIALNPSGSASIAPSDVFQSGSDNCGTANPASVAPNSLTCANIGPNTVTLTVNDGNGNTAICNATVTVQDNALPTIVCPQNLVRNTDPNLCTAIVTYAAPTVMDNCSNWTLMRTSGQVSGSAFTLGANMVEWKVTDPNGNMALCQFTVTVSDAQAPAITCPANIVRNTDAGLCTAVVTYANPTYSDNCTGAGLDHISGGTSGSAFPKGVNSVTWQATDGAGLTKRCTFTVTVNDNQAPTITCPANQTRSADANTCTAAVTYLTPTGADNCGLPSGQPIWISGGTTPTPSGSNSVSTFPKGQTTVLWRATDAAGLVKTCTFRVTVNDTQAPAFTFCPSSQSLNTDAGLCSAVATYDTPTASDNCTPPPTVVKTSGLASGSAFPKGASTVVWKATDGAGLTKICSFTVTVTDAQLPTIACPGNISVAGSGSYCNATVAYANPTATDNCEVQSLSLLSGLASGSSFPQGVTNNVWRAIDNSGGSATCAFTVTVSCQTSGPSQPSQRGGDVTAERDVVAPPHRGGWEGPSFGLSLFPNPATTEVTISVEHFGSETLTSGGDLTVLDAQGRVVWQQQLSNSAIQQLLVADFAAGLYFVTLRNEGQAVTKRLVVQRL